MKLGITMLIHNKDDIEFVTEIPCFWDTLYLSNSLQYFGIPKHVDNFIQLVFCFSLKWEIGKILIFLYRSVTWHRWNRYYCRMFDHRTPVYCIRYQISCKQCLQLIIMSIRMGTIYSCGPNTALVISGLI